MAMSKLKRDEAMNELSRARVDSFIEAIIDRTISRIEQQGSLPDRASCVGLPEELIDVIFRINDNLPAADRVGAVLAYLRGLKAGPQWAKAA